MPAKNGKAKSKKKAKKFPVKALKDLKPAPYNPRSITPEELAALRRSMEDFGDLSGIVFNTKTSHLVSGHQRISNLQEGEVVLVDESTDDKGTVGYGYIESDGTRWPVRFVEWNKTWEKAANVAANSPYLTGKYTDGVVDILDELKTELPDLVDDLRFRDLMVEMEKTSGMFMDISEIGPPDLASGGRAPFQQMTFTLHDSQAETVKEAIAEAKAAGCDSDVNENSNGNALAVVCQGYIDG